jgi:VWFA-related protein
MNPRLSRSALCVAGAALALALGVHAEEGLQQSRTIFVSAMNGQAQPVSGLQPADFAVQEDNQLREITEVKEATEPAAVVLMIDTSKEATDFSNDIRTATAAFVNDLLGAAPQTQIALAEVGGAGMIAEQLTSDKARLLAALPKLAPKPRAGQVVNEGLVEASRTLAKAESPRRFIVVFNIEPGTEESTMAFQRIADEVRKSSAVVWSFAVQKPGNLDHNDGRNGLLEGLSNFTGGIRSTISTGPALENVLRVAALNIAHQYAVTFTRPDGKAAERTAVMVKREGIIAKTLGWSPK